MEYITADAHITKKEIAEKTGATMYAIKKELSLLKEEGVAEFSGFSRNGHWEVKKRQYRYALMQQNSGDIL